MTSDELQRRVYNRYSDYSYQLIFKDFIRIDTIRKTLEKICRNHNRMKILDVGCADGELIKSSYQDNQCYGIDIAINLLKKAKEKGVSVCCCNLERNNLPFKNTSLDLVICSEVIEHVIDTDHLLSEINRVLKFNGFLLLSFPNINQPISWMIQILLDYTPMYSARYKAAHVRDFTLRIMKKALQNNGFKIKSTRGTYIYPFKNRISQFLAKNSRFAEKFIIAAIKRFEPNIRPEIKWNVRDL